MVARHRLWMLKKDVIEDTLKVLNGSVPLTENFKVNLSKMNNADIARNCRLDRTVGEDTRKVTDAVRKIQRGLL